MKTLLIAYLLIFSCVEGAELIVTNISRQLQASNLLYDSVNILPGDAVIFQLTQIKNPTAKIYLWLIDGHPTIKTETPELNWTVTSSLGPKQLQVIAIDEKSRIDGSTMKLFVGSFEQPVISIVDGARRPGCSLTVRANVRPYMYALVPAERISEYHWELEREGQVFASYCTNTSELEFELPQEPGMIGLRVSAVDAPEAVFPIDVKPW